MRRRLLKILAFLVTMAGAAAAQELSHVPGAFADLALGVRPAGLGGAYTALSNDGNAIWYNPAATAFVPVASLTATTTRLFGIVPATYLGLHYPARNTSLLAGIQQVGDDLLRETTVALGVAVKAPHFLPASFSGIPFFDRMAFSIGLRVRLVSFGNDEAGGEERITGDGRGYGLDLGYLLHLGKLRFGATLHDLIGQFGWRSSGRGRYVQNVPRRMTLAAAFADPRLRFAVDVQPALYADVPVRVAVGIETNLTHWLVLRTGVSQNVGGLSENKSVSFGFGLYRVRIQKLRVAVQGRYRSGEIANSYQFSLDFFWPGAR